MLIILVKTIVIYLIIILVMRAMGKKQAGQLQPYELVITLMIAEVAATPMDSPGTPISYGLVPAVTLLLLYFLFTFITLKSRKMRTLLCGKPCILIHNGKIRYDELRHSHYSLSDLVEQLRIFGNTSIPEIHYAILETNGQLSVLPYAAHCPVTPEDLSLRVPEENLCASVVLDGSLNPPGMALMGQTPDSLRVLLQKLGYPDPSEILICTYSDSGEIFLQDKGGNTRLFHLHPQKGAAHEA